MIVTQIETLPVPAAQYSMSAGGNSAQPVSFAAMLEERMKKDAPSAAQAQETHFCKDGKRHPQCCCA